MGHAVESGPGGAREQLTALLRRAMTDKGWKQSDLAKAAELSAAAVSNALTGKSVPTLDTLDRLCRALGVTGPKLRELRTLRDAADARVRRLDRYLAAAQRAARDHPYPGVLPGTVPPLASVYQRQHLTRRGTDGQGNPEAAMLASSNTKLTAEDVLASERMCVVLAGPGGGKSSLLRTHLATQTRAWLAGRGKGPVPVLIPAAALADLPLARALAEAVTADLAWHGLIEELPTGFFAAPAQPGVAWQVLVDGLDEVTDPEARRRILRGLAAVRDSEHASLYRFAIATRPLPTRDLDALGPHVPCFHLEPFKPHDLASVACNWFRALGMQAPRSAAERFAQALERSRLADLARIPLVASMLCQLHADSPSEPLPASRGQIYHDFIALLHERQYSPGAAGALAGRAGLNRYGPGALAQAERTLDHLHDVIAHLAAERRGGSVVPAITIVESQAEAQRPPRVPIEVWRAFLRGSLRASGLLIERADDLVFLHQTLLEYLAARHATRDLEAASHTLEQVFHQTARYRRNSYNRDAPGVRRRLWWSSHWEPPKGGLLLRRLPGRHLSAQLPRALHPVPGSPSVSPSWAARIHVS